MANNTPIITWCSLPETKKNFLSISALKEHACIIMYIFLVSVMHASKIDFLPLQEATHIF
jgi:hypothetical protein